MLCSAFAQDELITPQNNGYQIPNSDFENWVSDKEPGYGWNSFASATGSYASFASMSPAPVKVEGRNGGTAVRLNSKDLWLAKANGNLTTGVINMGNMTPTDSSNHNYTDLDNEGHNLLFAGQPDSVYLYAKFISGGSEYGRGRFILHDKYEYHDPEQSGDDSHKVAEAAILIPQTGEWTRFCAPFTYTGLTAAEGEQYMLASITTNPVAGGSDKDTLYVDDITMIYNSKLDSITIADNRVYTNLQVRRKGKRTELTLQEKGSTVTRQLTFTTQRDGTCRIQTEDGEARTFTRQKPETPDYSLANLREPFLRTDTACVQGYIDGYDPRLGFNTGMIYLSNELTQWCR